MQEVFDIKRFKGFAVLEMFSYDLVKFLLLVFAFIVIIMFFIMVFPDIAEGARKLFTRGN